MKITTTIIALIAILLLISPGLQLATAQSSGLLACIASFTLGGGDISQCCLPSIIDETADLVGLPIVNELANSILGLCCTGNILSLEESCCVEPLIGFSDSPIVTTCCGGETEFLRFKTECCGAIPELDFCTCSDPTIISENPSVCCDQSESFHEEQLETCCSLDNFNDSTFVQCCGQSEYHHQSQYEHCCGDADSINENDQCCSIEVFPEGLKGVFEAKCCSNDQDIEQYPGCTYTPPEPPEPPTPPKPIKRHASRVINHQQVNIKLNIPFTTCN